VFLTAILPPQDEEEFFRAIQILQESVYMFHSATSRQNIHYRVHEVKREKGETVVEAICQLVKKKLEQYLACSKIVVYGSSVEQTVEIGEALGCPIYHRSVND
jgi:hypothetical protein